MLATLLHCVVIAGCLAQTDGPMLTIGAVADCQYCDYPDGGVRQYRRSVEKLRECVTHYNTLPLDYVVHLGDFIDRDWESFDVVLPITQALKHPLYHVLGNHDFSVPDGKKALVHEKLGMPSRYHDFAVGKWRFVITDGNDVSLHGWPKDSAPYLEAKQLHESLYKAQPVWNGAIGAGQLQWIESVLKKAQAAGESAVLYCHFPLYPADPHCLWNAEAVIALLEQYPVVKAWINGHNHNGDYGEKKGIHYLTLKGMVDTAETSYAVLRVYPDRIDVDGIGREPDRTLIIRR
ncbi:MAG: metallophosphoesterase [Candidatus Hydrogenedentes bacterium]|nr:metallophosphoesterase [Candidatus Hydrogenedentota bacterium]